MTELFKNLYCGNAESLFGLLSETLENGEKLRIITANPEMFMKAREDKSFAESMTADGVIVTPDGIGTVKAAEMLSRPVAERLPGIETLKELLKLCSQKGLSVYFYGAKADVLSALSDVLKSEYPGINTVGLHDGYSDSDQTVAEDIIAKNPDLIVAALGIPHQELFLNDVSARMQSGVFIGVGGSLDVISGTKKRAPKIFIKLNCEWLYRILCEPSRLGRFYRSNIKFFSVLKKELREEKKNGQKN